MLVERKHKKIKVAIEQLSRNTEVGRWKEDEREMVRMEAIEELEVEVIKKQGLPEEVKEELIKV